MKSIPKNKAAEMIREMGHLMFTVEFTKKDGSNRIMNCRTGVKKHTKGGVSTIKDKDHLIGVYDVQTGGYRCINIETLKSLKMKGETYHVE